MNPALENLISALARLPGLGKRSAERAALALIRREQLLEGLMRAMTQARDTICICSQCGAFTSHEEDPCRLCTDERRDKHTICVVEEPSDIELIEQSGAYKGLYHALMGKLSVGKQMGPADLRIDDLVRRVDSQAITEVIFALGTDMESETTLGYVLSRLEGKSVKLSCLARGIPVGSAVAYADPLTLKRAIQARQVQGPLT